MKSVAFGMETFPRDTIKECRDTIRNLKRKAKQLKDGVKREFSIELGSEN